MTEQQVSPNAVAIQVVVIPASAPGAAAGVAIRIATGPLHQTQAIIDADTALQVAEHIRVQAREAKKSESRLHVPPGLIVPNGQAVHEE